MPCAMSSLFLQGLLKGTLQLGVLYAYLFELRGREVKKKAQVS